MSHFYGKVAGNRGLATRCGTKNSGMIVYAKSHNTQVDIYYSWDRTTQQNFVSVSARLSNGKSKTLYHGPESKMVKSK